MIPPLEPPAEQPNAHVSKGLLFLGEAIVDLVCEHYAADVSDASSFVPRMGGVMANAAVNAARAGGESALAGGIGEDAWGRWLHDRLVAEGVDVTLLTRQPDYATPVAFVVVPEAGEPTYILYGDPAASTVASLEGRLHDHVAAHECLVLSSNTLVGEVERRISMDARSVALSHSKPVIVDPNLRFHRWGSRQEAVSAVLDCVPGTFLLRCNALEAEAITGEESPHAAAIRLRDLGALNIVISLGPNGALVVGNDERVLQAPEVTFRSSVGAGDALLGAMVARLAADSFDADAVLGAVQAGLLAAARACERWGAVD